MFSDSERMENVARRLGRATSGGCDVRLTSLWETLTIYEYMSIYIYIYIYMPKTAKLFQNGGSQAVRLPSGYRFEGTEVFVRRDPSTGDVILSRRPESWEDFFEFMKS